MDNRDDETNAGIHPVRPSASDDVQQVDAEPMDATQNADRSGQTGQAAPGGAGYRFGTYASREMPGGARVHVFSSRTAFRDGAGVMPKPPVIAAWACLIIAWFFLGSRAPFTIFLGIPFDLAALLLAMVCLSRGGVLTGLAVLSLGTLGSLFVYIVGLFRFLAMV